MRANEVVPRERLIDTLWGEQPPERAAGALQVYVHGLRKALGPDRVTTHGTGYAVRVAPDELDLHVFEGLVGEAKRAPDPPAASRALHAALALWRGPALADLAEEPVGQAEAARLDELRLAALEQRIEADLALGRHDSLIGELEGLIGEHPFREKLRSQLMVALYRAGRQAEALEAYQQARRALVDELGIEPGAELQELERAILRQAPELAPPRVSAPPPRTNLPAAPTPLLGRELELAAVTALLHRGDVRLLTLTGAGGTGKTRLALAAAEEVAASFADGVCFVDLAPVIDSDLVALTVAQALAVPEVPGTPLEHTLGEHLRDKRLLLLLDNFEHLLAAAPLVAELLRGAAAVKALATSRARLQLSGEHEYAVPPLALPPPGATLSSLLQNEAVQLFVARARAVAADFRLTESNAEPVAEICRALDGLPLAIELAAARSKLLPPPALLSRLGRRLDLTGARDLPARQRTLRATIEWSYGLLDADEQALLARLSVFVGGFTLGAAEDVGRGAGGAVLEGIASLVDRNLLVRDAGEEEPTFRMLETIREYGLERLEASGEAEAVRRCHAEHFLAVAEAADKVAYGGAQAEWWNRLATEDDNLRTALAWAAETGESELYLQLAIALWPFWHVRGLYGEGRLWLERALAAREQRDALRARGLAAAGALAYRQGDYEHARTRFEAALGIFREIDDALGTARMLGELGNVAVGVGDYGAAFALYEETAASFRSLGHEARPRLAQVLGNMGALATMQGDAERGRELSEAALEIQLEVGNTEAAAMTLHNLARIDLEAGRLQAAADLLRRSLEAAEEIGYREVFAYCLEGFAEIATADGDLERAARLLGASDVLFDELGAVKMGDEKKTYEQTVRALRERLGEAAFESARAAGRALTLEEATRLALASTASSPAGAGSGRRAGAPDPARGRSSP